MSFQFPGESEILKEEIHFTYEDTEFRIQEEEVLEEWIKQIIITEGHSLDVITYVFCSDEYLHKINMEYLNHDTYTDIITFPLSDENIESDIFISIDRIKENALLFQIPFLTELYRVIIHGVLHLCGFGDKTETEKKIMRSKEEESISELMKMI